MVKTYKKLDLFGPDLGQVLSILAVKVSRISKRTSEILFIDKWYEPSGNNGWLREYGTEARGLVCLQIIHLSMRPSWDSADALSIVQRRRR